MRGAVRAFVAAALAFSGLAATSAFNYGDAAPRAVTVSLVGDAAAYLALEANAASPHDCFVDSAGGELSVTFDATTAACGGHGGGAGVNAGDGSDATKRARYAFHDLLRVRNLGTRSVNVWANATTSSGGSSLVEVAKKADSGAMGFADYAASSSSSILLAPGEDLYLGVRVDTGSLSGGSVQGAVTVEARRA